MGGGFPRVPKTKHSAFFVGLRAGLPMTGSGLNLTSRLNMTVLGGSGLRAETCPCSFRYPSAHKRIVES